MNPLLQLYLHGQSYWLDTLTRDMIRNGELARRVRDEGLRGVTSNPAIFRMVNRDRPPDQLSDAGINIDAPEAAHSAEMHTSSHAVRGDLGAQARQEGT